MNKHECLDAIRKLQFFAVDLNLYLDNFPNCTDAIDDKINNNLIKDSK